ncbi:MAG: FIST C-terminal domain-containing protein [Gammaproteobacteria bacterium]|nr:FIST C-terminal domain-containing protein [Gammaproteobacteria bacterium]
MINKSMSEGIRQAVSVDKDTASAAEELLTELQPKTGETVLCFSSAHHSTDVLEEAFQGLPADINLLACKTAGEITSAGYIDNSLTGVVLPSNTFISELTIFDKLDQLSLTQISSLTNKACTRLAEKVGHEYISNHCFAMLLIDGLSQKEEMVAAGINNGLSGIPLFGGSSADDVDFENAWIYCQNEMRNNSAALLLVYTKNPFQVFKTEHISCKEEVYVTTKVNASERQVLEVDGYPAAEWYASIINTKLSDMTNDIFAKNPVTVKLGGQTFVRAIQSIEDNGAIRFYCAIDEGILLYLGQPNDLYRSINNAIEKVSENVGKAELIIGCDCMLRYREAKQDNLIEDLSKLFIENKVIGFSTFGEQFGGMHINQTFTGIAIGSI